MKYLMAMVMMFSALAHGTGFDCAKAPNANEI